MAGAFTFREWYERNGDRLNEKRKSRYQTDPDYRQRVLQTNQESRAKRKKVALKQKRKRRERPVVAEPRWKVVELEIGGVLERLYSIGAVAESLGCSIQAIRLWERQGHIPKTEIRTGNGKNGDRLYTQAMVEQLRGILTAQGRLNTSANKERPSVRSLTRYVSFPDSSTREVQLFLIGALAKAVNRNVVTLEQLEAKGFLPRTPFRASRVGRRLYTGEMIASVKSAFKTRGEEIRGEEAWKSFYDDVLSRWTAQGVMGAVLVQAVPEKVVPVNAPEPPEGTPAAQ